MQNQIQAAAQAILSQLGGGARKIAVLTGAKNFFASADEAGRPYVCFSLPKGTDSITKKAVSLVQITLNEAQDLYEVQFVFTRGGKSRIVRTVSGIFAADLQRTVEIGTSLYFRF